MHFVSGKKAGKESVIQDLCSELRRNNFYTEAPNEKKDGKHNASLKFAVFRVSKKTSNFLFSQGKPGWGAPKRKNVKNVKNCICFSGFAC